MDRLISISMAVKEKEVATLFIDTALAHSQVALLREDGRWFDAFDQGENRHSEVLLSQLEALLKQAQLSVMDIKRLALAGGPGSYTGLRIGLSTLKGLFFGLQPDLFVINTLAWIAQSFSEENAQLNVVLDARRSHFYHQAFEKKEGVLTATATLGTRQIADLEHQISENSITVGIGVRRLSETFRQSHNCKAFFPKSLRSMHVLIEQSYPNFVERQALSSANLNYLGSPVRK